MLFYAVVQLTCLYIVSALSWNFFSLSLSLLGWWRVWSQMLPRAMWEYASLLVWGCFRIRSNFFWPGPHSILVKWRLPIKDQPSGCSLLICYNLLFLTSAISHKVGLVTITELVTVKFDQNLWMKPKFIVNNLKLKYHYITLKWSETKTNLKGIFEFVTGLVNLSTVSEHTA